MPEGELRFADENELAAAIRKAIGAGDYERVRTYTPEFDRIDGRRVYWYPSCAEELDKLKEAPPDILQDMGLGIWDTSLPEAADSQPPLSDAEWIHWLFPAEWYEHIPSGYPIATISGKVKPFVLGKTDSDRRMGFLPYGFIWRRAQDQEGSI